MKYAEKNWTHLFFSFTKKGIVALGLVILFSAPQAIATADAQIASNHFNWNSGMAAIAEQQIRKREERAEREKRELRKSIADSVAIHTENSSPQINRGEELYKSKK